MPVSAAIRMSPPLLTIAPVAKDTVLVLVSFDFATTVMVVIAPPVSPSTTASTVIPRGATPAGSSPAVIRIPRSAATLAFAPNVMP